MSGTNKYRGRAPYEENDRKVERDPNHAIATQKGYDTAGNSLARERPDLYMRTVRDTSDRLREIEASRGGRSGAAKAAPPRQSQPAKDQWEKLDAKIESGRRAPGRSARTSGRRRPGE